MPRLARGSSPTVWSVSPPSPTDAMARDTVHWCLGTSFTCASAQGPGEAEVVGAAELVELSLHGDHPS
jgi:hypothetical protein